MCCLSTESDIKCMSDSGMHKMGGHMGAGMGDGVDGRAVRLELGGVPVLKGGS